MFTRQSPPDDPRITFVAGDAAGLISGLLASVSKHIWLVGGGTLVSTFLQERLIDEFVISVHPVVLGAGIPLFATDVPRTNLRLVGATSFDSGLMQPYYTTEAASKPLNRWRS